MSRQVLEVAETNFTKISAGPSRVTGPAELNEMVQYNLKYWDDPPDVEQQCHPSRNY